jgi:hypothetical protein
MAIVARGRRRGHPVPLARGSRSTRHAGTTRIRLTPTSAGTRYLRARARSGHHTLDLVLVVWVRVAGHTGYLAAPVTVRVRPS